MWWFEKIRVWKYITQFFLTENKNCISWVTRSFLMCISSIHAYAFLGGVIWNGVTSLFNLTSYSHSKTQLFLFIFSYHNTEMFD